MQTKLLQSSCRRMTFTWKLKKKEDVVAMNECDCHCFEHEVQYTRQAKGNLSSCDIMLKIEAFEATWLWKLRKVVQVQLVWPNLVTIKSDATRTNCHVQMNIRSLNFVLPHPFWIQEMPCSMKTSPQYKHWSGRFFENHNMFTLSPWSNSSLTEGKWRMELNNVIDMYNRRSECFSSSRIQNISKSNLLDLELTTKNMSIMQFTCITKKIILHYNLPQW